MIRVLIVDDSAVVRTLFTRVLSSDPEIEVVGTAPDPYVARERLVALKPDVITLDIEMPRMDGATFLEKVMQHFPTRTLIVSSLTTQGSEVALRALELGAIDVMAKPAFDISKSTQEIGAELIERVKMVARANLRRPQSSATRATQNQQHKNSSGQKSDHILAIASSTGGTEALKVLMPQLPSDIPATLIVQHMPPVFTKTFAMHLQRLCPFEVREAVDGDAVVPGRALIAPGDFHMEVIRKAREYYIKLHQGPLLNGVRPAADHLFQSVAQHAGAKATGVILTGMGKDGARGLLEMKKAGSFNIAQDKESSVIYGMPKSAIEIGAIHCVLDLSNIAGKIVEHLRMQKHVA